MDCFCSVAKSCLTLCDPMDCQAPLFSAVSRRLLKLMSFEWVRLHSHLFLCHVLLLLPSVFSSISVFSNEYSGLISFRIDWLDLLAVQGTLKSLFQHHSSKASVLQHSAFFIVQLSHQYLTTATQNVFQLVSNVGTPKAAFDVTLATMACMHAC